MRRSRPIDEEFRRGLVRFALLAAATPENRLIEQSPEGLLIVDPRDGVDRIRTFAGGISPEKPTLATHPDGWRRAIEVGLPVTPWTFRASTVKGYATVTDEMVHFLHAGAAGVITDNPDLAP